MPEVLVHLVSAFSHNHSGGSLTGVVTQPSGFSDVQMQSIAAQSVASHVAFVETLEADEYRVRFFTAAGELKNCAHATIAAHWLLASQKAIRHNQTLLQQTKSGPQQVWVDVGEGQYSVRFGQNAVRFAGVETDVAEELIRVMGLRPDDLHPNLPIQVASPGTDRFLLPVVSRAVLDCMIPDFAALERLCRKINSLGCFVYHLEPTPKPVAFARMFAPAIGVSEDVINGNSSGCLGAYLLQRSGMDEIRLEVFQGMAFDSLGLVKVIAQKVGDQIETYLEGSAWDAGVEHIALD